MLPRGYVTVISCQQGVGKSWLVQRLACDLSLGGTVLDGISEGEPVRKVLFCIGESRKVQFIHRAKKMNWSITQKTLALYDRRDAEKEDLSLELDTAAGQERIDFLLAQEQPDVVFIDSMYDFHDSDESKAKEIKRIMSFLNGLAEKYNVAVVLSHHTRKRKTSEQKMDMSQDEVVGSNVILRSAAMLYMPRLCTVTNCYGTTVEDTVLVKCEKSWMRKPAPFGFKIEDSDDKFHTSMRVILNPDLGGTQRDKTSEIIQENFQTGDWFSRQEIIDHAAGRVSVSTIQRTLRNLQEKGIIVDNGEGSRNLRYSICDVSRKEKDSN